MGWVKKRFDELNAYEEGIPELWNTFREAVGKAITEFNDLMRITTADLLSHNDCLARGSYCVRVYRSSVGACVEIYLKPTERTVELYEHASEPVVICGYRPLKDYSGLEFYVIDELFNPAPGMEVDTSQPNAHLTADEVCEVALHQFLFDPSPKPFQIPKPDRKPLEQKRIRRPKK